MKQVTMESVKQRIAVLESAGKIVGGLSLSSEFELACLRDLVAVTEQRDALVVENVALKDALEYVINPDNQPGYHDQGMGCGVEDHGYQRNGYAACSYGWESAMERVYSEVIPDALPETPATSSAIAALRAEGVEMFAKALRVPGDDPFMDAIAVGVAGTADNFARQLRESKGVNHA